MSEVQSITEYRDVPGFPGYRVGDDGSVWSGQRELRGTRPKNGYIVFWLWRDGQEHQKYGHHLVLEAFVGHRPAGQECLHGNGNRRDNRRSNLRWGTSLENSADMLAHGTRYRAEWRNGNPEIECACGCGKKLRLYDLSGRRRTFVSGHNLRKVVSNG